MARKVFFSFHYQRDIFRVNVVRNSWLTRGGQAQTFFDRSLWEQVQRRGDQAIRNMILKGLHGTSVTVVLVGAETYGRKWLTFEIEESYRRGNGIIAVHINGIKAPPLLLADQKGKNPLSYWQPPASKGGQNFSEVFASYDWVGDNGFANLPRWIEEAARKAGK